VNAKNNCDLDHHTKCLNTGAKIILFINLFHTDLEDRPRPGTNSDDWWTPFYSFVDGAGYIDFYAICVNPFILLYYLVFVLNPISIFYQMRRFDSFTRRQNTFEELFATPDHQRTDKRTDMILDMSFWSVDFSRPIHKATQERLLAHFERKLPVLMGRVVPESYTSTETEIMESLKRRKEILWRLENRLFWAVFLNFCCFGMWYECWNHELILLGPDPVEFEQLILNRIIPTRTEMQAEF